MAIPCARISNQSSWTILIQKVKHFGSWIFSGVARCCFHFNAVDGTALCIDPKEGAINRIEGQVLHSSIFMLCRQNRITLLTNEINYT